MTILVTSPGVLVWQDRKIRCALGPNGIGQKLREGDGLTPQGIYPLRRVFYRPDQLTRPQTRLPLVALSQGLGWCDDPASPEYNTLVDLPSSASHEKMWRDDNLYNLVVEVGFNDDPVVPGRGSAVFMHVARPDYSPTQGCIAITQPELLTMLAEITPQARLDIRP